MNRPAKQKNRQRKAVAGEPRTCGWWSSSAFIGLLLTAATLAICWPVLGFDFVNYDDPVYVSGNSHVLPGLTWAGMKWSFTTLEAGFWQPLTWLSYMLDLTVWGNRAGGFHLTNLLLHTANGVLLFRLLETLTGARWRSALVAALFALHPLHVEPVAWIASRKDVLSTFFGFLSLIFYARYAQARIRHSSFVIRHYLLSLFFFALGLMSKTMLVTWPFLMLLLDYWPLRRISSGSRLSTLDLRRVARLVWEKVPFLALAALAGWLTLHAERGSPYAVDRLPLEVRMANALLSYAHYLRQTVWPSDLIVCYPYPRAFPILSLLIAGLLLAMISTAVIWQARRRPYLMVGWLWYGVALLPVIGLIQAGSHARADRYTYVPLIGVFLAAVWGAAQLGQSGRLSRMLAGILAFAVLAACAWRAGHQLRFWKNTETLFRRALTVTPGNTIAHFGLGQFLYETHRVDDALDHWRAAIRLDPAYIKPLINLGAALAERKQYPEAIRYLELALSRNPDSLDVRNNLGGVFAETGRLDEAIVQFGEALRLKPDDVDAHFNLAGVLAARGNKEEAIRHYREVLRLKPDDKLTRNNLRALGAETTR